MKSLFAMLFLISVANAKELTNCDKAEAYFKAAECAKPFMRCNMNGDPQWMQSGSQSMASVTADAMQQNAERIKADALVYQMLCNKEKE